MSSEQAPSTGTKLKDWLIESFIIFISILLAFWLNNWGEDRSLQRKTNAAMCNIKAELIFNRDLLVNDYVPRHKDILRHLKSTKEQLSESQQNADKITILNRPLFTEKLRSTAWNLAIETGYLLHVDFAFATEIAVVYDLQEESYMKAVEKVIESLFQIIKTQGNTATFESQSQLSLLFQEWMSQEAYLVSYYQKLLENKQFEALECVSSKN